MSPPSPRQVSAGGVPLTGRLSCSVTSCSVINIVVKIVLGDTTQTPFFLFRCFVTSCSVINIAVMIVLGDTTHKQLCYVDRKQVKLRYSVGKTLTNRTM